MTEQKKDTLTGAKLVLLIVASFFIAIGLTMYVHVVARMILWAWGVSDG